MAETVDSNTTVTYTFRFGLSDKSVQLTQQQLNDIPYLATFISHKDDFLSAQNENGEYVLNSPIEYNCFMAILRAITTKNPYTLFNELPEDENILDMLQLRDYLGINSFPLPLLKNENLVLSNSTHIKNEENNVKCHRANLSESRQTAAEFIIALANNEYELHDSNTKKSIITLIDIILFNTDVFSTRFRYHTLTIVKKRCYSYFSKTQQRQIQKTYRIAQYKKVHSSIYLSDDNKPVPDKFNNVFSWKGDYVPIEHNQTNFLFATSEERPRTDFTFLRSSFYFNNSRIWLGASDMDYMYIQRDVDDMRLVENDFFESDIFFDNSHYDNEVWIIYHDSESDRVMNEAKSARSGHFNTLAKRPMVDKFKHRCGPKAQKYR